MQKLKFEKVKNIEEYENFLIENDACFTQSHFYGDWHKKIGREVSVYKIEFEGKIVCAFQAIKINYFLNRNYLYAPYGPVVDWSYFNEFKKIKSLNEVLEKITKENECDFFRLDFNIITDNKKNNLEKVFARTPIYSYKGNLLQVRGEAVIDLKNSTDDIFMNLHKKHRNAIRNAIKKNIQVEIVSDNINSYFSEFIKLLTETANRNSFGLHPIKYYEEIFNSLEKNKNGYLVISKLDGKVIGVMVFVIYNKTINFIFAGSSNDSIPKTYIAHWENIKYCKEIGIEKYNFGGISTDKFRVNELNHVTEFKIRFGTNIINHSDFYDVINKNLMSAAFYKLFNLKKFINYYVRQQ